MNLAIIDLGTNTFHLMIVKVKSDGSYKKMYKTKTPVKLGKGGITEAIIAPESYERGVSAIKEYKKVIDSLDVKRVFAFGTSAIRNAKNGQEFIEDIYDLTGIKIKSISGEEEAEYICHGVWEALDIGEKKTLIIDIGGGSIEFIIADNSTIYWKRSYEIGVARLLEKFKPSDPISPKEISEIENYLEEELATLFPAAAQHNINSMVGASGSFDTFAEMIAFKYFSPDILKRKTSYQFEMKYFQAIHEQLLKSTVEERKNTKGVIAMRVDMIVLASIFVNLIIKKIGIQQMHLSAYALKEGVLAKIIKDVKNYL
jgi:exopolyphosphatase / guanosine-5'-triphosphate,3'-diphosphate pyrophosphatase